MLHDLIEKLSNFPGFFLFCRSVLEANFTAVRRVIGEELTPRAGRRVLDLGCGPGAFAPMFPSETYCGVDINDQYVRYARAHHRGSFAVMDATRLEFEAGSFDDVLVFGLLHHLADPAAAAVVSELHRVVRPDGRLLVIEDIPTRSRLNLVGHLVHRIENGHHIRPPEDYRRLLAERFVVRNERLFRSGVCDYYAAGLSPAVAR